MRRRRLLALRTLADPPAPYLQFFRTWTPSLALWGAGAGVTALYVRLSPSCPTNSPPRPLSIYLT